MAALEQARYPLWALCRPTTSSRESPLRSEYRQPKPTSERPMPGALRPSTRAPIRGLNAARARSPDVLLPHGFDPRDHSNFNFANTCRRQDCHIGIPIPLDKPPLVKLAEYVPVEVTALRVLGPFEQILARNR